MVRKVDGPRLVYKRMLVNLFGIVGYCVVSLQLLIVLMTYFDQLQTLLYSSTPKPQPIQPQPIVETVGEPSAFSIALAVLLVIVMLGLTIYVFLKAPAAIAKTGSKVIHKTSDKVAPALLRVQHKKDTKPNRRKLSAKLVVIFKSILVALPLLAVVAAPLLVQPYLDFKIAIIASAILAIASLACFAIQYGLAFFMKLDRKYIW